MFQKMGALRTYIIYKHTYMCMCVYIYTCDHIWVSSFVYIYIYLHIHTYICVCVYVSIVSEQDSGRKQSHLYHIIYYI